MVVSKENLGVEVLSFELFFTPISINIDASNYKRISGKGSWGQAPWMLYTGKEKIEWGYKEGGRVFSIVSRRYRGPIPNSGYTTNQYTPPLTTRLEDQSGSHH